MTPYIPDMFADVVAKTNAALMATPAFAGKPVYFDFGHYEDVTGRQQKKSEARDEATKRRYPLIWLVMDFEEDRRNFEVYANLDPAPMVIIATNTQEKYSMKERRDKTFLPVLYPIYEEFMRQINQSKWFGVPNYTPHVKVDRPYWSGADGAKGNLFNDAIDAIQLKNLKLRIAKGVYC